MKKIVAKMLRRIAEVALPVEPQNNFQLVQRDLYFRYRDLLASRGEIPSFRDTGFRNYSQSDEDGLLLYLFSIIGFTNRLVLDVAAGAPIGGNTTNLIVNWDFHGLLLEGNDRLVEESTAFYQHHQDTLLYPPRIRKAWITAENINQLVSKENIAGDIDLFSLDVDGVDYWLWEKLDVVTPRIVMVEYQDMFFADEAVTVPYSPDFNRFSIHPEFFGASLAAFVKLAHRKGYRLVGCNRYGFNAFFVRNDLDCSYLPEVSIDSCLTHPRVREFRDAKRAQVLGLPWETV